MKRYIPIFLKGLGQIMLQESAMTGFLFGIGIAYHSLFLAGVAMISVITGTMTAVILEYDTEEIQQGLYGFSPALTGIALAVFFKPIGITWLAIAIGIPLSAILQHLLIQKKIPGFTLPFVVVTWAFSSFLQYFFPDSVSTAPIITHDFHYLSASLMGLGQVIFQPQVISGFIFLIALAVHSPIAAIYGFLGSYIAILFYYFIGEIAPQEIALGLFSYNAVLCAIAMSGKKTNDIFWAFGSILLSIGIEILMRKFHIPLLTFPFVLASFIMVSLKKASFYSFLRL